MKNTQTKHKESNEPQRGPFASWLREMGIVFGIFLVLNSFVIASFEVPTGSMENEIMTGDFLLVNKFIYGGTTPRTIPLTNTKIPAFKLPALWDVDRGDVIVFIFPGYREEVEASEFAYYLKRCVAIAGDTLEVRDRVLFVNGKQAPVPLNMTFDSPNIHQRGLVDDRIFPPGAPFNEDNYGPVVIPKKGMVINLTPENYKAWAMFIKREHHATEKRGDEILVDGKKVTSYTVERDYLFGMGDHRDNSLDSRFWGFIPKENVIGTPLIVYWSWNPELSIFNIFDKLKTVRWSRIGTLVN